MKISALVVIGILASASASNYPKFTVHIQDGNFADLDGLRPTVKWESTCESKGFDIKYGADAKACLTTDILSLPQTFWGKFSRKVGGWNLSTKASVQADNLKNSKYEISADNEENDFSIKMLGSAGKDDFSVSSVENTMGFSKVTERAKYNFQTKEAELTLGCDVKDGTYVQSSTFLDSDRSVREEVTVAQLIGDNHRIAPTVTSDKDLKLEWKYLLEGGDYVTTTYRLKDSLDVKWRDGPWTVNMNVPLEGYVGVAGTNVNIKRDLNF
mmetsp:Transcript_37907/g.55876  ORF Transcript_37907/g.55876 Transcript_37907/m.55876 type:complete len:269 (-) Transcript_37907:74-880(-)|eukprot:CAMPEP_0195522224 /NCGR_PEP_ID=MMETSP0794_2-20130614/20149_1 /TAXON_ID=515487 /ORGANISM="Stephanopyxis turris, Strain CCMP 815" /LENGTH=268 /DNA_ID=CAMNT_0040651925 /DNA_START=60 /DNA_END=866 /DNA_ORIENTATION=-